MSEGLRVVGQVKMVSLDKVKPNEWNPNRMTAFEKGSLKHGLETDGWIASQALLVWGTDENGKKQNVIIDGEHRFTVATELGFEKGPMVFLEGITMAQAKALTIKMNAKRGSFNKDDLGSLLQEIRLETQSDLVAFDLGISDIELSKLLKEPEVDMPPEEKLSLPDDARSGIPASSMKSVALLFSQEAHSEFGELVRELAVKFQTKTVAETVLESLRKCQ